MYEERIKSGINPIWAIPVWAVGLHVIYIVFGIIQILIGYDKPYFLHAALFAITVLFGWYFVSKFLTEYSIGVSSRYITVTKYLSRKTTPMGTIRSQNIVLITDNKDDIKKFKITSSVNYIRAFQKGNKIYIVENENGKHRLTKLCLSGMSADDMKEKFKKEGK